MTSSFKNLAINDTGYLQLPSGTSAQRSNYIVQTFTTVGTTTWTAPTDVTSVEVLVIAGGGGGGRDRGGGGGAGGLVYNNAFAVSSGTGYTVTVGAGGLGAQQGANTNNAGFSGTNSVFGSLTAIGGGGGGDGQSTPGTNGGSGGGGGNSPTGNAAGVPGSSTQNSSGSTGFGNAGGAGVYTAPGYGGGGGGGAGSAGIAGTSTYSGSGGLGQAYAITGVSQFYAGGGGAGFYGATSNTIGNGAGGSGVGGIGGNSVYGPVAGNGVANTGSGGGSCGYVGGGSYAATGGNGGSGIVVIRYKQIVRFTSTGSTTWTVPSGVTNVEVLVVAGGGGGGGGKRGGGGGGGGVLYRPYFTVTPGAVLNVTVGAGGSGASAGNVGTSATAGGNSLFGTSTNLITNGNLTSNTTGWTDPAAGAEGTFVAGANGVTITATNAIDPPPCIYQAISCVVGSTYQVSATRVSGTASIVVNATTGVSTGGGTGAVQVGYFLANQTGTLAGTFVATQTTHYIFLRINENATTNVTMTGISVYDVTNTVLAIGGGKGGTYSASGGNGGGGYGGSGGGACSGEAVSSESAGTGSTGQGSSGGAIVGLVAIGAGGGGAGGTGESRFASDFNGGNGGLGIANNITGVTRYYGGGGGAGARTVSYNGGLGGLGGGGNGGGITAGDSILNGTAGIANTGGGGGGGGDNASTATPGAGGSGIVIVSYNSVNTTLTQRPGMIRMNPASVYAANGIESFKHIQSSSVAGLNWTAPDGLVCLLDAGNTQSYPGTGTAWYDISGNNRHWTINPSYAVYNSGGQQSYFNFDGTSSIRTYQNASASYPFFDAPVVGPASDKMGFNGSQEHTCIAVVRVTATSNNFFFSFALTPQSGAGDFTSRWSTHLYYGGGSFYYDYPGCCGGQARVYKSVQDASWVGNLKIGTWRCRRTAFPQRQFFRNTAIETDSGNENTGTATWNRPDAAILGGAYNGRIYYIAWYNRALSDAELATQWAYLQARFGIT